MSISNQAQYAIYQLAIFDKIPKSDENHIFLSNIDKIILMACLYKGKRFTISIMLADQ